MSRTPLHARSLSAMLQEDSVALRPVVFSAPGRCAVGAWDEGSRLLRALATLSGRRSASAKVQASEVQLRASGAAPQ